MMAKVRSVNHGRIKPKYDPKPNAREKKHKAFVKDQSCFGCGSKPVDAHHSLLDVDGKRWRRDHLWLLPLCHYGCHQGDRGVHGLGSEKAWLASIGQTQESAIAYMRWLQEQSE